MKKKERKVGFPKMTTLSNQQKAVKNNGFSDFKNQNISKPRKRSAQANRRLARTLIGTSLLIVIGAGFTAVSQASNDQTTSKNTSTSYTQITVGAGESLWSLATAIDPTKPADLVSEIVQLNHLSVAQVFAGQKLVIPTH
jgi:LysM repeat protein